MKQKQIIKVISTYHDNYDAVVKTQTIIYNGGFYLYGKVEDYFHYDVASFVDLPQEFIVRNEEKALLRSRIEGIFDVEVLGYPNECVGFFWMGELNVQRGLIVDKDDEASFKDAYNKYNRRERFI